MSDMELIKASMAAEMYSQLNNLDKIAKSLGIGNNSFDWSVTINGVTADSERLKNAICKAVVAEIKEVESKIEEL